MSYESHLRIIKKEALIIDEANYIELMVDLTSNFKWNSPDNVDITPVMNRFEISSPELFYTMYSMGNPCNFGYLSHDDSVNKTFTVEKAKIVLEQCRYHIDWYNGHGIKTFFRENVNEEQIIAVRRFDERNYEGCFYKSILTLIKQKK
jgi:hypothetical protein